MLLFISRTVVVLPWITVKLWVEETTFLLLATEEEEEEEAGTAAAAAVGVPAASSCVGVSGGVEEAEVSMDP